MTRLLIDKHTYRVGAVVVEVWQGDEMIAAIYPTADGVRVISKHFVQDEVEVTIHDMESPIAVDIHIKKP